MFNHHQEHYTDRRISDMKLMSSASDQNVFFTYICLINEVKPSLADTNSVDRGLLRTSFHIIHDNDEVSNGNYNTLLFVVSLVHLRLS